MIARLRQAWYVISGRRARVERAAIRILAGLSANPDFAFAPSDAEAVVAQARALIAAAANERTDL